MHRITCFVILLLLALGTASCDPIFSSELSQQIQMAASGSTAVLPAAALPEPTATAVIPITMLTREIDDTYNNKQFTVTARYPHLEWENDPRVEPLNEMAEGFVNEQIDGFLANAAEVLTLAEKASAEGKDGMDWEPGGYIDIRYELVNSDYGILSYTFWVESYVAPSAHPGHLAFTINYDMVTGKSLALEDLFLPGAPYLDALADYCRADLSGRNVDFWPEGLQPTAENYQSWNITSSGLRMIFNEYQVAPYVYGPQQILIPYNQLQDLLPPDGRLAGFLQP